MSFESWKKEFYPIPADEAAEQGALAAAKHSLQKWRGLREEHIKRHGVNFSLDADEDIVALETLDLGESCSLCSYDSLRNYGLGPDSVFLGACGNCPIYTVGGKQCNLEYAQFQENGDPEPMIELLERTVKGVEAAEEAESLEESEKI